MPASCSLIFQINVLFDVIYCDTMLMLMFVDRYLDRYEKVHFLGEVGERANDDDEDNRHRRWSARALHSVPLTYNYSQHNVNGKIWAKILFCCCRCYFILQAW